MFRRSGTLQILVNPNFMPTRRTIWTVAIVSLTIALALTLVISRYRQVAPHNARILSTVHAPLPSVLPSPAPSSLPLSQQTKQDHDQSALSINITGDVGLLLLDPQGRKTG